MRTCKVCGKTNLSEGYCIDDGMEYYCSDKCLHTEMTDAEWLDLYDDGNGTSYWTEWSDTNETRS